jgi:hypothetical protein
MHEHNTSDVKYVYPYLSICFFINYLRQEIINLSINHNIKYALFNFVMCN